MRARARRPDQPHGASEYARTRRTLQYPILYDRRPGNAHRVRRDRGQYIYRGKSSPIGFSNFIIFDTFFFLFFRLDFSSHFYDRRDIGTFPLIYRPIFTGESPPGKKTSENALVFAVKSARKRFVHLFLFFFFIKFNSNLLDYMYTRGRRSVDRDRLVHLSRHISRSL